MPTPPLTEEQLRSAAEAFKAANGHMQTAANLHNPPLNERTMRNRIYKAAAVGLLGTDYVLPGFEVKRVGIEEDGDGSVRRRWITQKPAGGDQFEVPDGHVVKGVSALVDAQGRVQAQWVKTGDGRSIEAIKDELRTALAEFAAQSPPIQSHDHTEADLASLYPFADFHLGLLSWRKETGENWDLDIASKAISEGISRLVGGTPESYQAVLLFLGDLLHADGYRNATPASGNLLDVDGRYPRVLQYAARLIITATMAALAKHERVLIRIIPGNHDPESSIALTLAVSLYFQNEPRVKVDDDAGLFWWWEWGQVLLGAAHGDKARMDDLPLIMAARNSEAWGRTKHRLIFTGHVHKQTAIEKLGVTVESFRSPAAPDAWSHGMGYGAGRTLTSITFHKERGEISRQRVNVV